MEEIIQQIIEDYTDGGFEPDGYYVNKEHRVLELSDCGGNEERYKTIDFDEVMEEYGINLDEYED